MIRNQANAEHYLWGQGCDGWRLADRPDLSVIQERIPPGRGEVLHVHERARQVFVVLSGRLTIAFEHDIFALGAGESLEVPPRQRHRVRNDSTSDVSFLVISAPSTKDDRQDLE